MANILIIGCGAIGYALATTLAAAGHQVTGIRRSLPPTPPKNFTLLRADITSATDVATIACDYEQIFLLCLLMAAMKAATRMSTKLA